MARVGRPGRLDQAAKEVEVSRWLRTQGVSAVEAVAGIHQLVMVDRRPVTFWVELPQHRAATPAELGAVLRALHAAPRPSGEGLPELDPLARCAETVETARFLTLAERRFLRERLADLSQRWQELPPELPPSVVHGDAWQGNAAVSGSRAPVLLDLEAVSVGPPEWDLVPLAADAVRFKGIERQDYRTFVAAYGHDVTDWAGFDTFADLCELRGLSS